MDWIENETAEERHTRVDAIVERNATPDPICITCLRPIRSTHTKIDSRHGAYHGPPNTCVDGR